MLNIKTTEICRQK